MTLTCKRILALLSLTCLGHARAQPTSSEQFWVSIPDNFKLGADLGRDGNVFKEFVKKDQSVYNWSDMITVQTYRKTKNSPTQYLQTLGNAIIAACPGTVSKRGIISGTSNGYSVAMLDLWCPINPQTHKPETIIIRAIHGKDMVYSVQYAWRGVPSANQTTMTFDFFRRITACDKQSVNHPCPTKSVFP